MESCNQSLICNFNQSVMLNLSMKKQLTCHDIDRVEIMISENPDLLSSLDATSCSLLKDKFMALGLSNNDPLIEKIDKASSIIKANFLDPFHEISNATSVMEKLSLIDNTHRLVMYRCRKTGGETFSLEKPRSKVQYTKSFATAVAYSIYELPADVEKILKPLLLKTHDQIYQLMESLLNENPSKEKLKKALALITAFRDTCVKAKLNLIEVGLYSEFQELLDSSIESYTLHAAKLISKSFTQLEGFDIRADIKKNFVNDFKKDFGNKTFFGYNYELPGLVATDFNRMALLEFNGKSIYKNGIDNPNLSYEALAKAFGEAPDAAPITQAVCLLLAQGVGFGSLGKKGVEHFLKGHQLQTMDHRLFEININENQIITINMKTICYLHNINEGIKNYSNPVAICAKIEVPAGELKNAVLTENANFLKNLKVDDYISVPIIRKAQERTIATLGTSFDDEEAMQILKNITL